MYLLALAISVPLILALIVLLTNFPEDTKNYLTLASILSGIFAIVSYLIYYDLHAL